MKKIFLFAYTKTNLGDDIFLKMLVSKYIDCEFYINIPETKHRKVFEGIENIMFAENEVDNRNLDNIDISIYDAFIYIGGSIFIESPRAVVSRRKFNSFIDKCKSQGKPFFYVSSNFGPYKTEEYFLLAKETMEKCTDICFRDTYSFNLFSDIPGVRYAPDLIFSYDVELDEVKKDSIGISVIDFEIRDELKAYSKKYYEILARSIESYIDMGKNVSLFSFCEYEGDEEGIRKLLEHCSPNYMDKVNVVFYDGDIESFVNEYRKMEYMICTRFHSMILSLISNHKIYCVSYSNKMNNVIKDSGFDIEVKNIKELSDYSIELDCFVEADVNKVNICKQNSKLQLQAVDSFINDME